MSLCDDANVARLADALAWAATEQVLVNVELKVARDASAAEIELMIRAVGDAIGRPTRGAVLVSSLNAAAIRRWISVWPEIPAALLVSTPDALAVWRTLDRCAAIHPAGSIVTPALIGECRSRGQRIHVWTLNDPGEIKASFEAGVDAVITDLPEIARAVRARVLVAG